MIKKQNQSKAHRTNVRIAQIIMGVAALGAFGAGVSAFANVANASDATLVVETWRVIGFFTFAALFTLLAVKPETDKVVWWIVLLNKLALTIVGFVFFTAGREIPGVSDVLLFDGGLSILIFIALMLSRK
ncbi:MAG TPA: hypothetical protein VJ841_03790 [Candidatus Saccharimonadales bacterium]|nr:hypothetical protein [Candidatus Saccharimonadales bacterium]